MCYVHVRVQLKYWWIENGSDISKNLYRLHWRLMHIIILYMQTRVQMKNLIVFYRDNPSTYNITISYETAIDMEPVIPNDIEAT